LRPLLVNAPLGALGRISYSLYLVHIPVIWAIASLERRPAPAAGRFMVLVIASLIVALATYRLVEYPALRWMRRVTA